MTEHTWANANDFTAVFRCTNKEFAERFVKYGEIKFNTPQSWVNYALSNSEGRGDSLEGTVAFCHYLDGENFAKILHEYKYVPLNIIKKDYRLLFKRKREMSLPCFCFYILKNSQFECPGVVGNKRIETLIPGSYFRDFSDQMTIEEVNELSDNKKPAIIFIENFQQFKTLIINKLIELGFDQSEIIVSAVKYIDFNQHGKSGWMDFNQKPPFQLTIKEKRFINQSEARIIINSNKHEVLEKLSNPICIGSLEHITQVVDTYLYEGMGVQMDVLIEERD